MPIDREILDDTQANVSPYDIQKEMWSLIQPYFVEKYGVGLSESYPTTKVDKPTIAWQIVRRVPGGGEYGKAQAKGASFHQYFKVTKEGLVHEIHMQQQQVTYEWKVFATSPAEADAIAWDLENAILQTLGPLQSKYPEYNMYFSQQFRDATLLSQNEMVVRTIQFVANVPIKYDVLVKELQVISQKMSYGSLSKWERFTRGSLDKKFQILLDGDLKVQEYSLVVLERDGRDYALKINVDYVVKKDSSQLLYLEWNDETGLTPSVGENFRVTYKYSVTAKVSNFTK